MAYSHSQHRVSNFAELQTHKSTSRLQNTVSFFEHLGKNIILLLVTSTNIYAESHRLKIWSTESQRLLLFASPWARMQIFEWNLQYKSLAGVVGQLSFDYHWVYRPTSLISLYQFDNLLTFFTCVQFLMPKAMVYASYVLSSISKDSALPCNHVIPVKRNSSLQKGKKRETR